MTTLRFGFSYQDSAETEGKIIHERTKVLLLVNSYTELARRAVREVIDRYRKAFEQESVLWGKIAGVSRIVRVGTVWT